MFGSIRLTIWVSLFFLFVCTVIGVLGFTYALWEMAERNKDFPYIWSGLSAIGGLIGFVYSASYLISPLYNVISNRISMLGANSVVVNILPGTNWKHRNGIIYEVLFMANKKAKFRDLYPLTVIYINNNNGLVYTRPLHDWWRSFTLVTGYE